MEANYGDFCKKRNCVIQPVCKEFRYFSEAAYGIKAGKIAIIKNNEIQAVMISVEEYEKLKSIEEISERKEIFDAVQSRGQTPESEYVSYDEAMNNKI